MFHKLRYHDDHWRDHHRRYQDEPSLPRQGILIALMLASLFLLLQCM